MPASANQPGHQSAANEPTSVTTFNAASIDRSGARGRGVEQRRRLSPLGEMRGVEPAGDFFADEREALAKIDPRPELFDRGLPRADLLRGGRLQQPVGDRSLASGQPRLRDQLEERAGAKEVEVRGVDVIGGQVGLPGDAGARPAIFKPRDAAVVEAHGAPRSNAPGQQPVVNDGDDAEEDDRNGQPPGREQVP